MIWENRDGYQGENEDYLLIVSMNAKVSLTEDEEMYSVWEISKKVSSNMYAIDKGQSSHKLKRGSWIGSRSRTAYPIV